VGILVDGADKDDRDRDRLAFPTGLSRTSLEFSSDIWYGGGDRSRVADHGWQHLPVTDNSFDWRKNV
jgi:hypothetical protein